MDSHRESPVPSLADELESAMDMVLTSIAECRAPAGRGVRALREVGTVAARVERTPVARRRAPEAAAAARSLTAAAWHAARALAGRRGH